MNMPEPTNYLRLPQSLNDKHELYKLINKDTQVQIVQTNGRRWIKILYRNVK
jgi:exosome complex RNA-binding protein Rrp4